MKKIIVIILIVLFTKLLSSAEIGKNENTNVQKVGQYPFYVYKDGNSKENKFFATGKSGNYNDLKVNELCIEEPHSGKSCIEIIYNSESTAASEKWASLNWQYPENNWGKFNSGYDLTGAKELTFWAKGEKGGEVISQFYLGFRSGKYPDSDFIFIGPVELTKNWKEYKIDLKDKDLSHISNGFCWGINVNAIANIDTNGIITFYLDDIAYRK